MVLRSTGCILVNTVGDTDEKNTLPVCTMIGHKVCVVAVHRTQNI